uniref:Uncharacterized protein n=1 Tax=Arundo donax TaxID=35708 RepID=A0A0A9BAF6_ARUDO
MAGSFDGRMSTRGVEQASCYEEGRTSQMWQERETQILRFQAVF